MYQVKDTFADDYLFIGGNTKYLRECSQDEIAILIKNGKKNCFVKKTEEVAEEESLVETISTEIPALEASEKGISSIPKPTKQ
jgi:hypothetical protein